MKSPAKRNIRAKTVDSQDSQDSKKSRAKNYSAFESETLLKTCDEFHEILSKNSNRDFDVKKKAEAWRSIKRNYDRLCLAEGFGVSEVSYSISLCLFLSLIIDDLYFNVLNRLTDRLNNSKESIRKPEN